VNSISFPKRSKNVYQNISNFRYFCFMDTAIWMVRKRFKNLKINKNLKKFIITVEAVMDALIQLNMDQSKLSDVQVVMWKVALIALMAQSKLLFFIFFFKKIMFPFLHPKNIQRWGAFFDCSTYWWLLWLCTRWMYSVSHWRK